MPKKSIPEQRTKTYHEKMMAAALCGDMTLSISPATGNRNACNGVAWNRTVTLELRDSQNRVHTWLNKTFANVLSIADTAAANATIASQNATFVNGRASVVVSGSNGVWAANNTNTLTVGNLSVAGQTVAGGTSVETIV